MVVRLQRKYTKQFQLLDAINLQTSYISFRLVWLLCRLITTINLHSVVGVDRYFARGRVSFSASYTINLISNHKAYSF